MPTIVSMLGLGDWMRTVLLRHPDTSRRILEMLPGVLTWFLITAPLWGSALAAPAVAVLAVTFEAYWFMLGARIAVFAAVGLRRVGHAQGTDWRTRHADLLARAPEQVLPWESIHHAVIIPNYGERAELLAEVLDSLAAQGEITSRMTVVLAMEEREAGSEDKARALQQRYRPHFGDVLITMHPPDLPGEIPGKSSNEAWAARRVTEELVDRLGIPIDRITVTVCDADSIFHPAYFNALNEAFATAPDRQYRFWQPPMFFWRNAWQVPSIVRLVSAFNSLVGLAMLADPWRELFPLSTYSLGLALARRSGYWAPAIISEDWHMFLRCFYRNRGLVRLTPIFLPVRCDAPRSRTYWATLYNAYRQLQRHAWGASDIAYALRESILHPEIPLRRRVRRLGAILHHHLLWSTTWFLLTLGLHMPSLLNPAFAHSLLSQNLGAISSLLFNCMWAIVLVLVAIEIRLRPPCPDRVHWWRHGTIYLQWFLMPVAGLFLGGLPALHAQTRLMFGRDLVYRVTEKA